MTAALHTLPKLADHPAREHYRAEIAAAKRRGDVEYLACFPLDGKRHRVDEAALLDYARRKAMRSVLPPMSVTTVASYPTQAEINHKVSAWFKEPKRPAVTGR